MMESNRGKGDFIKVTTWRRQKEKTERFSYSFIGGLRKGEGGGVLGQRNGIGMRRGR